MRRLLLIPRHGLPAALDHMVVVRRDCRVDRVAAAVTLDLYRRHAVITGLAAADLVLTRHIRGEADRGAGKRVARILAVLQRHREVDRRVRDVERNGLRRVLTDPEVDLVAGRRSAVGVVPERRCNLGRDGHDQLVCAFAQVRETERTGIVREPQLPLIDPRAHQRHRNIGRRERVLAVVERVVIQQLVDEQHPGDARRRGVRTIEVHGLLVVVAERHVLAGRLRRRRMRPHLRLRT